MITNIEDCKKIIEKCKELGYDKLRDNLYFESLLPKFTPVIYLPNYRLDNLDEKLVEEMKTSELKGVRLVSGKEEDIPTFYKFVEHTGKYREFHERKHSAHMRISYTYNNKKYDINCTKFRKELSK